VGLGGEQRQQKGKGGGAGSHARGCWARVPHGAASCGRVRRAAAAAFPSARPPATPLPFYPPPPPPRARPASAGEPTMGAFQPWAASCTSRPRTPSIIFYNIILYSAIFSGGEFQPQEAPASRTLETLETRKPVGAFFFRDGGLSPLEIFPGLPWMGVKPWAAS
jgi:hypothetical protein